MAARSGRAGFLELMVMTLIDTLNEMRIHLKNLESQINIIDLTFKITPLETVWIIDYRVGKCRSIEINSKSLAAA